MDPKETHESRVKTLVWIANLLEASRPLPRVFFKLFFCETHALAMCHVPNGENFSLVVIMCHAPNRDDFSLVVVMCHTPNERILSWSLS